MCLSMNEMTTYRWSFEEDVARYRAAGIGAIGVWRQKLSDFGEDKGVELLAESGLKVSNPPWAAVLPAAMVDRCAIVLTTPWKRCDWPPN